MAKLSPEARARARFVERFVLPLVAGGEVHVGSPIGHADLQRMLEGEPDRALEGRLQDARWAVARELQRQAIPPRLDEEALALAVSVHDLLFLYHPDAGPQGARPDRLRRVATGAAAMARLAPTHDADVLVARHTILHLFPTLFRTDARISFWVGRREFHGQAPPARLTAWPKVRRVHEERWRVGCLAEAAADPAGGAEVVRALLAGSPLTDLLTPLRLDPRLDFSQLRRVLAEPEVCRIVAYRYLEEGLDRVGAPVAQAVVALLGTRGAATGGAAFALSFVSHLHLCALAALPSSAGEADLAAEAQRIAGRGEGPQRDFAGLLAAAHRVAPELAAPADVRADPRLARRVAAWAAACAGACGSTRTRELVALVARGLGVAEVAA